jgi:dTDP-4-amino-4,6-dideoxygalactose transaminase
MTRAAETTVPVADPRRAVSGLYEALERVLEAGRYIQGPEHDAFEAELAAFLGVDHCLGVASGTDALQLALAAVGCVPGDTIVAAPNAGGYAGAAARMLGLRVRLADVDPGTLGLSAATVEGALADGTRAVVVTHLYGLMCDVEGIVGLCRERGVQVIEDCAQAAGASRDGRRAGSFGDAAAFSFYPTKNLGCIGDGGAVVTNDASTANRVRSLRQYGWSQKYVVETAGGWNSRLDELQAAILRIGLPQLDARNARRREIVQRYAAALPARAGRFVSGEGGEYVAHLAVILADDRARLRNALEAGGIGTDVHYPVADHRQPAWADEYGNASLSVTEHAVEHVLTVPCFPELTDDEVGRVCEVLRGS